MKTCARCGFLNPDMAEFCMKCRLDVRGEGGGESIPLVGNALSGSAVGKGPVEETAPEKPALGAGVFDEPPSWARKPGLAAPAPDLDDTFAGRGPDTGGYMIGGGGGHAPSGPAVSDAFSIMTSGNALAGSEVEGRRRGKRTRSSSRRPEKDNRRGPPGHDVPGSITGLPPALGDAGFQAGMRPEKFPPPAPAMPPVPRRPGPGRSPGRAASAPGPRTGRTVSMPDLSFLKTVLDAITPRIIVGALGGILVLLALAYLFAGGNHFKSDARKLLEVSRRAMHGLGSFHLQAEVLMNTEKAGSVATAVAADVSRDGDSRAAFADAVYHPAVEYVTASGRTCKSTAAGRWEASLGPSGPDFTSAALFSDVSGSRFIDRQVVDGVECDHVAYEGGARFAGSFFPGVETTEATASAVEIWVDPQTKYVRHVRVDAAGLETIKLGRFDCHIEASLSGFNAPVEIKPPM